MSGTAGPVTFDYSVWVARYPELASSVGASLAGLYFSEATLYLDNSACSRVRDTGQRLLLLNMLTAHIAKLNASVNGMPAPDQVGRIASATEGSVSASFEMPASPNAAWFNQTKYGAAFWQATARYRVGQYYAGQQPYLGVGPYGGI